MLPFSRRFSSIMLAASCSKVSLLESSNDGPATGLLNNVDKKGRYYTSNLDLKEAAKRLSSFQKDLADAMQRDYDSADIDLVNPMIYIDSIKQRKDTYLDNNELCGLSATFGNLKAASEKGIFTVVVGSPSVGKTLMAAKLMEELPAMGVGVLRVNGRDMDGNLVRAIATASEHPTAVRSNISAWNKDYAMEGRLEFAGMQVVPESINRTLTAFASYKPKISNTHASHTHNMLLIDEFSSFLKDDSAANREHIKEVFQVVVKLTKERREMAALWMGSDPSLPYLLQKAGCNLMHVRRFIIVGEPSPQDVSALLRDRWGVGPHLSRAIMEVLGGHVLFISYLLDDLQHSGQDELFKGDDASLLSLFACPALNVRNALSEGEKSCNSAHLIRVLKDVARKGCFEVKSAQDKAAAELLVRNNVCAVVLPGHFAEHVPRTEAQRYCVLLVPTLQVYRILIAAELDARQQL